MTLRAQGFVGASARKGGVPGMLRRVGGVQLDTISVLARSHELVAYARLGAIPRDRIERAYWNPAHPTAFEYWAHAACVLPMEEWPYYAFRRRWFRARGMRWHEVSPQACEQVLAQVRAEGPLTASQLGGAKGGGPWWDWSAVKVAAEWLLDIGELVCVRRAGWRRVYDLPERAVPAELLAAEPSDEECVSHLVGVAARALGVATHADLTDYHRLQRRLPGGSARAAALDDAARAAGLTPVTIAGPRGDSGPRGDLAAWADPAALAAAGDGRREHHRVTLLSPFDSLIWDRKRTARLFGFEHSLEAYVPKAKRVHGYFVMPLLAGGRLVGRVDPVRRGRTLVARQVSLDRPSAAGPMARALREAAEWVGCDQVEAERVTPADSTRGCAPCSGYGEAAQLNSMSFSRTAIMTASIREWICSFSRMLRTWFFTVFSEMNSSLAMSRLFMPRATSLRTSISRSVSLGAGTCCGRSSSESRRASVANSVSSLPAMDGLMSDWPPCTARTASATSSSGMSLSR